jgi:hypothetical protein
MDGARRSAPHAGGGETRADARADADTLAAEDERVEMPAVDRRRFADGGAAMLAAASLALAITGQELGFRPEFREAAPASPDAGAPAPLGSGGGSEGAVAAPFDARAGAIPHRLDAPDGLHGVLRDQALAIAATLAEYRLTGDGALLDWGLRAADWAIAHLWDDTASAFRSEPAASPGGVTLPPMFPLLANGEMAFALADLADHVGRPEYRERAERVVSALGERAMRSPAGAALALAAQRLGRQPAEADLDGDPADLRTRALARAVVAALGPTTVVRWSGAGGPDREHRDVSPGAPRVTVCAANVCLPPAADPRELVRALTGAGLAPRGILAPWSIQSSRREDGS